MGNGGLTRTRGSSFGINRYNRAHSSSDDAGSQSSDSDASQGMDTDGNTDANVNDAVLFAHGAAGDRGRSSGSGDGSTDGSQAGHRDGNDDASSDPSNHASGVGHNVQPDDEGDAHDDVEGDAQVQEGDAQVPDVEDELEQIVQIDLIHNVEQVFNARNNAPNHQVRGNVVGDDTELLEDAEVQYDGVDRDLRPIVRHDLIEDRAEFFNQRNDAVDDANAEFVEIEHEGQDIDDNAVLMGQQSGDDSSSDGYSSDPDFSPNNDGHSASTPVVNIAMSTPVDHSATEETQETPTVTAEETQTSLLFGERGTVGSNIETPTQMEVEDGSADDIVSKAPSDDSSHLSPYKTAMQDSCTPYSIEWSIAETIDDVIVKTDVLPKGDCGFIGTLKGLIVLRQKFPNVYCSDAFVQLEYSWDGVKRFRKLLLSYFNQEYSSFCDHENSLIQDWTGHTMRGYYGSVAVCNSFRKRLWTKFFDQADVGLHTMKPIRHWFHVELICPIISRLFEVSIYVYANSYTDMDGDREVSHPRFTTVYLYRPDICGVMTTVRYIDVLRPHSDRCLLLYHSPGDAFYAS